MARRSAYSSKGPQPLSDVLSGMPVKGQQWEIPSALTDRRQFCPTYLLEHVEPTLTPVLTVGYLDGLRSPWKLYDDAGTNFTISPKYSCIPDQDRPAVRPPSTTKAWPFIKPASSLANHSTAFATSIASPGRGSGWTWVNVGFTFSASALASEAGRPNAAPKMGVGIGPGHTQFTRIPCSPSSVATLRVN